MAFSSSLLISRLSAQRSLRGLDPKRRGDVRELAVLLTPFEEGIDAHIPAQPMVERKNGLVATVSTLALNVASRTSLNGCFTSRTPGPMLPLRTWRMIP